MQATRAEQGGHFWWNWKSVDKKKLENVAQNLLFLHGNNNEFIDTCLIFQLAKNQKWLKMFSMNDRALLCKKAWTAHYLHGQLSDIAMTNTWSYRLWTFTTRIDSNYSLIYIYRMVCSFLCANSRLILLVHDHVDRSWTRIKWTKAIYITIIYFQFYLNFEFNFFRAINWTILSNSNGFRIVEMFGGPKTRCEWNV